MQKLFTLFFALAVGMVMHVSAMQIWPIMLDGHTSADVQDYIVSDFRPNDVDQNLYIWNETYAGGEATGLNFYGNVDGYIALVEAGDGWAGMGFCLTADGNGWQAAESLRAAIAESPDDYFLHLAIKSTDQGNHCFYIMSNETTKFVLGAKSIYDGPIYANFERDGSWAEFYVPMSEYADALAATTIAAGVNVFITMGEGIEGTQLNLDAIYFCDKEFKENWKDDNVGSIRYTFDKKKSTAKVIHGDNYDTLTIANIPAQVTYDGQIFDVKNINQRAFNGCSSLKRVSIPNSVTNIGEYAFYGCSGLTSIDLPDSVTSIGKFAFSGCSNITSVIIGKGVISIGSSAFYGCSGLTSIQIESNNTAFDSRQNCNAIIETSTNELLLGCKNTIIPNSVTSIGNSAFYGCSGLTGITIPTAITNIGSNAFYGCDNLTSVTWNAVNCEACYYPFRNTPIASITFGEEVRYIPANLLDYTNTNIKSIVVPKNVQAIGAGALSIPNISVEWNAVNCADFEKRVGPLSNIASITFGNEVKHIPAYLFNYMSNIFSLVIPSSVQTIGQNAFFNCYNLTSVTWNAVNCEDFSESPFAISQYSQNPPPLVSITFGEGVKHIPAYLCDSLTQISSILISSSVQTIGSHAFANINNRKFNNLILPLGIVSIGDSAFAGNTYIEHIDFGKNLETIGEKAFDGCSRVATMTCLASSTPDVGTNALTSISSYADLFVLNTSLKKYQVDPNWNRFLLKTVGANETITSTDDVTVEPGDNTVTLTWPTDDNAASYTIQITKDGVVFCTLIFNSNGQLIGIAFAPSRDRQSQPLAAKQVANGLQFTVTGLNSATHYAFSLTAKDSQETVLASYTGEFTTTGVATAIDQITNDQLPVTRKIIKDNQIFILRGDKVYTVTGQEVK